MCFSVLPWIKNLILPLFIWFCHESFWLCREIFGCAMKYLVVLWEFLVVPWDIWLCREMFGCTVRYLVVLWHPWATVEVPFINTSEVTKNVEWPNRERQMYKCHKPQKSCLSLAFYTIPPSNGYRANYVRLTNQRSCQDSGQIYVISVEFLAANRRRHSSRFARSSGSE